MKGGTLNTSLCASWSKGMGTSYSAGRDPSTLWLPLSRAHLHSAHLAVDLEDVNQVGVPQAVSSMSATVAQRTLGCAPWLATSSPSPCEPHCVVVHVG